MITQAECDRLVVGDIVVRDHDQNLFVIVGIARGEGEFFGDVIKVKRMGADGAGHGRMLFLRLDMFSVGNFGGK